MREKKKDPKWIGNIDSLPSSSAWGWMFDPVEDLNDDESILSRVPANWSCAMFKQDFLDDDWFCGKRWDTLEDRNNNKSEALYDCGVLKVLEELVSLLKHKNKALESDLEEVVSDMMNADNATR